MLLFLCFVLIYKRKRGDMEEKIIHLSTKDLDELKSKAYVASGTQADVFNCGNGFLYKIYYDKPYITPYEENIKEAIKRQQNVKNTSLPNGLIYVDGTFRGCVLKSFLNYKTIYYIKHMDKLTQYKILKQLLMKVDELCSNNIYPLDLGITPSNNQGNVLFNGSDVEIIDLDGHSANYTNSHNNYFYHGTLYGVGKLIQSLMINASVDANSFFKSKELLDNSKVSMKVLEEVINIGYWKSK